MDGNQPGRNRAFVYSLVGGRMTYHEIIFGREVRFVGAAAQLLDRDAVFGDVIHLGVPDTPGWNDSVGGVEHARAVEEIVTDVDDSSCDTVLFIDERATSRSDNDVENGLVSDHETVVPTEVAMNDGSENVSDHESEVPTEVILINESEVVSDHESVSVMPFDAVTSPAVSVQSDGNAIDLHPDPSWGSVLDLVLSENPPSESTMEAVAQLYDRERLTELSQSPVIHLNDAGTLSDRVISRNNGVLDSDLSLAAEPKVCVETSVGSCTPSSSGANNLMADSEPQAGTSTGGDTPSGNGASCSGSDNVIPVNSPPVVRGAPAGWPGFVPEGYGADRRSRYEATAA